MQQLNVAFLSATALLVPGCVLNVLYKPQPSPVQILAIFIVLSGCYRVVRGLLSCCQGDNVLSGDCYLAVRVLSCCHRIVILFSRGLLSCCHGIVIVLSECYRVVMGLLA